MAYQALLFCPDEKTARTVTQVLSELEFSVEAFSEPFAAVKKLMAEHYDAVVVDCENEQNGTLLFKSARTSASNQSSLAVAVVEGQAGVAKAFRIGANLVLTKPINVEQAKGTLRVARGLLRKGDAKPIAAPAAAAPPKPASVPVAPKPAPQAVKPVAPRPAMPVPAKPLPPVAKPAQPVIAAQAKPIAPPVPAGLEDILESPAPAPAAPIAAPAVQEAVSSAAKPVVPVAGISSSASSGAASAAAPARIAPPAFEPAAPASATPAPAPSAIEFEKSEESAASSAPAPSFTFGGANAAEEESAGGSKKVIIGVVAAAVVLAGLYFGWTQFHSKPAATASPNPVASTPAPQLEQPRPAPAPSTTAPSSTPSSTNPATNSVSESANSEPVQDIRLETEKTSSASKGAAKSTATTTGGTKASAAKSEPEPILVRNGNNTPVQPKPAAVEAPAPSVLGIAPAASGAMPNLGVSNAPKPVLQTLNISQGVSQGLLIKRVQPIYPSSALRMRIEGAVQLSATITRSGNISAVTVLSGEPVLAKAAQDAVKQWKYKPYYLNGDPVEIQTQITVNFKLPK